MLSLLYSTVLLYYICFCFVLSCTLLIGGNKEILLYYSPTFNLRLTLDSGLNSMHSVLFFILFVVC